MGRSFKKVKKTKTPVKRRAFIVSREFFEYYNEVYQKKPYVEIGRNSHL